MKIGLVYVFDPADPGAWRGKQYNMIQELGRQFSLIWLGPLIRTPYHACLFFAKHFFCRYVIRKGSCSHRREIHLIKSYSAQISRKLSNLNVDIVLSITSPGSQPIAYLDCHQPIVIWTDATLAGVMYTYDFHHHLCAKTKRDGFANEKSALGRCSLAIYSSDWAAQTAIEHYSISRSKVRVVPFGPGMEPHDKTIDEIESIIDARPLDTCKLLFVGANWERKGGEIALQVAEELNELGINTGLTVVGCHPPHQQLPEFVKVIGFVNKNTPAGLSHLRSLYAEAHFLIVPTRNEAFGHVYVEASSFGVPSLATNTGGVSTAVRDGFNGKLFAMDANIADYCEYVSEVFTNYHRYKDLAMSSFNEYQSRLNWATSVSKVKELLLELKP